MVSIVDQCNKDTGNTVILSNPNHLLNSDCQTFVRDYCQTYGISFTKQELKVIYGIYDVLDVTGTYASKLDFPYLSTNNFTKIISRINKKCDLILKPITGKYPMFSLKGYKLSKNVRVQGTGVHNSYINHKLQQLYNLATKQPPFMHDIKLSCTTINLYDKLLLQPDIKPNPNNLQFIIPVYANPRFTSNAQISRNGRLDLHIGCSQLPISCTIDGFSELTEYVGEVKQFLRTRANFDFNSPPVYEWIFNSYHFNRDTEPIIDPSYRFSLGQHLQYFYVKEFENGIIKGRYEEKRVPKTTVKEECHKILFQKDSEMFGN
ncbi:hypothetical protein [Nitrosopumilus sp. S4]